MSYRFRLAACQIQAIRRLRPDNELVLKELGALPKTLDEMYSRVLLAIDDDERLFVAHVLHWIYFYPSVWGGSISLRHLVQLADLSTRETQDHTQKYGYDKDTLLELCGCLITVTPQTTRSDLPLYVEFAHYTVLEYLKSRRIIASPASMFAWRNETIDYELPSAILREALHGTPQDSQKYRRYAARVQLKRDITYWCVATAILFLLQPWQQRLSRHAHLRELVFELLRPSRPGYTSFSLVRKETFEVRYVRPRPRSLLCPSTAPFFSQIEWLSANGCEESVVLLSLVHFQQFPLAEALIREKNSNVFLSKVSLRSRVLIRTVETGKLHLSAGTYDLSGTIVEVAAQLGWCLHSVFPFLIKHGSGFFDPSKILHLYFGNWSVGEITLDPIVFAYKYSVVSIDVEDNGVLETLLRLGADPNLTGYRLTPLQIAAALQDDVTAGILLEHGADPTKVGSENGISWSSGSAMHEFNRELLNLYDVTPLEICRWAQGRPGESFSHWGSDCWHGSSPQHSIEKVLLEAMAATQRCQMESMDMAWCS